jgi:hypothetical protein
MIQPKTLDWFTERNLNIYGIEMVENSRCCGITPVEGGHPIRDDLFGRHHRGSTVPHEEGIFNLSIAPSKGIEIFY